MIFLILSIFVMGLIIGALGRLVVPGHNSMGVFATALVGIGGAFLGGIVARLLWPIPANHRLGAFICEVLGAAALVAVISGSSRRRRVYY